MILGRIDQDDVGAKMNLVAITNKFRGYVSLQHPVGRAANKGVGVVLYSTLGILDEEREGFSDRGDEFDALALTSHRRFENVPIREEGALRGRGSMICYELEYLRAWRKRREGQLSDKRLV